MFNLPSICEVYNATTVLSQLSKMIIDYRVKKAQVQAQPNFDENKFKEEYCKNNNLSIEYLNSIEPSGKKLFTECSQSLGNYELININSSLNSYNRSQETFKKTINYFDATLESLLSTDNATFDKTKAKIKELNTNTEEALKGYINKFKGEYDNLTIETFNGKNVSNELAMQRYAQHVSSTFLKSNQAKKENEKAKSRLKKNIKPIARKMNLFEQKKLNLNGKISNGLYASNYSIAQVDDTLGDGYLNKKHWNENLAIPYTNILKGLVSAPK